MNVEFWILAAIMITSALLYLMRPFFHHKGSAGPDPAGEDGEAYLRELKSDVDDGRISAREAEQSRQEMQKARSRHQALTGTGNQQQRVIVNRLSPVIMAVFLPLFVLSLYSYLGRPDLVNNPGLPPAGETAVTPGQVEQRVTQLEQRLRSRPDDIAGWRMLFQSFMVLERYGKAVQAAERLYALQGENPDTLLRYADALAMNNNQDMSGKPRELIERAVRLAPDSMNTLWLAGLAAGHEGDWQQALDYWQRLLPRIEDTGEGSRAREQLVHMMEDVRARLVTREDNYSIQLNVSIDEALREKLDVEDADRPLFIFAAAETGSPMPVAAVKMMASGLPFRVELDNQSGLQPDRVLSDFASVKVTARISLGGQPIQQTGDLYGVITNVRPGSGKTYDLSINQVAE